MICIKDSIIIAILAIVLLYYLSDVHETIHVKINDYFNVRSKKHYSLNQFYVEIDEFDLRKLSEQQLNYLMSLHLINEIFSYLFIPSFVILFVLLLFIYLELIKIRKYFEDEKDKKKKIIFSN